MQGTAFYILLPLADLDLFASMENFPTANPSKSQMIRYDGKNVVIPIDDEIMKLPFLKQAFAYMEWFLSQLWALEKPCNY